jgi:hypothetical protein
LNFSFAFALLREGEGELENFGGRIAERLSDGPKCVQTACKHKTTWQTKMFV